MITRMTEETINTPVRFVLSVDRQSSAVGQLGTGWQYTQELRQYDSIDRGHS
jgi:hypothetical protein